MTLRFSPILSFIAALWFCGPALAQNSEGTDAKFKAEFARNIDIVVSAPSVAELRIIEGGAYKIPFNVTAPSLPTDWDIQFLVFASHKGAALVQSVPGLGKHASDSLRGAKLELSVLTSSLRGPLSLTNTVTGEFVTELYRIESEGLKATFLTQYAEPTPSIFQFGKGLEINHIRIPTSSFKTLLSAFFKEQGLGSSAVAKLEERDRDIGLTMVKLGAASPELVRYDMVFQAPELPFYYDGIMFVPVAVSSLGDQILLSMDTGSAPPVILPLAAPDGPDPFKEKPRGPTPVPQDPLPDLELSVQGDPILFGREARVGFTVRHGPLPVGAEIYVILTPVVPEEGIFHGLKNGRITTTKHQALDLNLRACESDLKATLMSIRNNPISIDPKVGFLPLLEAGRLGAVTSETGGRVVGTIDFVAPALSKWYTAMAATPTVLEWDMQEGRQCARVNFSPDLSVLVPLLGR